MKVFHEDSPFNPIANPEIHTNHVGLQMVGFSSSAHGVCVSTCRSRAELDLVMHGLKQFFLAHLQSGRQFFAMPSKAVGVAWHAFILHTRAYEAWCHDACGGLLHHTPAEVLGRDCRRNNGLRRTWYWACKEESTDPRKPSRLPLLFALDKKFAIVGGLSYVPHFQDIDRKGVSGDSVSADSGGCGGGCRSGAPMFFNYLFLSFLMHTHENN